MEEVQKFVLEEEKAVSRNVLLFNDVCISEHQGTWHMLSMKPRKKLKKKKKFDTITGTFVFHCASHHLSRSSIFYDTQMRC